MCADGARCMRLSVRWPITSESLLSRPDSTCQGCVCCPIPAGPTSGESSILKRAKEMRSLLFTFGGLSTTKAVIQKFLTLGEVQRLLDEDFGKSRQQDVIDARNEP